MNRLGLTLAGLIVLAGCDGGGGSTPVASQSPPTVQPDMLTATSQGLLRGKASGQGQQLIFSRPNLQEHARFDRVLIGKGLIYYPREAPSVVLDYPNDDIWSVRTDGTGDHAVLNTGAHEFVKGINGSVAIYDQSTYTLANGLERTDYGSLRDGVPHAVLPIPDRVPYSFMAGTRAFFNNFEQVVSVNVDGSDVRTHLTVSPPNRIAAYDAFDNRLLVRQFTLPSGAATVLSVPLSGGAVTSLDDGQSYVSYVGHVGSRVVLERCVIDTSEFPPRAGACDVVSVNADGSGRTVLAADPANEAVQGIMGNKVIIRRNLNGNDHLIAVPVTGGAERPLMTMTDSEFVQLTLDDLVIVRRPSGMWKVDVNGTLTQLGTVALDSGFLEVGNAVCANKGLAVWCMPLDGQGQAVKIADDGKVIGAL